MLICQPVSGVRGDILPLLLREEDNTSDFFCFHANWVRDAAGVCFLD